MSARTTQLLSSG